MLRLLTIICAWRDIISRIHDESLQYTIADNDVWEMAREFTAGINLRGVLFEQPFV
jgi:hypothetical protein